MAKRPKYDPAADFFGLPCNGPNEVRARQFEEHARACMVAAAIVEANFQHEQQLRTA